MFEYPGKAKLLNGDAMTLPALCLPRRVLLSATLACIVALELPLAAGAADRIIVERDEQEGVTTIVVPAGGGLLNWQDVWLGLAQAARLDGEPLAEYVDLEVSDLTKPRTRLAIRALSAAVPDVSLRVIDHPVMQQRALWIELEGDETRTKVRRLKSSIRKRFGRRPGAYGLQFDDHWEEQPSDRPLVVLVHGYSASPDSLSGIRSTLVQHGWPCAFFAYPNDGPLVESGELLASELSNFGDAFPDREVIIVAHSMGGLVARAAIEYSDWSPGNVRQLIMVCTPNHGTQWAHLPGGLECWEYVHTALETEQAIHIAQSLADGLNEARSDLKPDSKFLRALNERPRKGDIHYSLILGTGASLTQQEMDQLRERVTNCLSRSDAAKVFLPRVKDLLSDF